LRERSAVSFLRVPSFCGGIGKNLEKTLEIPRRFWYNGSVGGARLDATVSRSLFANRRSSAHAPRPFTFIELTRLFSTIKELSL
jgi:hypothetical protein